MDDDGFAGRLARRARQHLGLDVAFVSEFVDGRRVFRAVDAAPGREVIEVGGSDELEESYCLYVTNGMLPGLLTDATEHPLSSSLAATETVGVRAHLSVPVVLADGTLVGTLCSFGFAPRPDLGEADLDVLRLLAGVLADHLDTAAGRADTSADAPAEPG